VRYCTLFCRPGRGTFLLLTITFDPEQVRVKALSDAGYTLQLGPQTATYSGLFYHLYHRIYHRTHGAENIVCRLFNLRCFRGIDASRCTLIESSESIGKGRNAFR
jgi:hypothetical protein